MAQDYVPGDVVETSYGVGVVTQCPSEESTFYRILLWRLPGKSIGSSSIASLQHTAVSYYVIDDKTNLDALGPCSMPVSLTDDGSL